MPTALTMCWLALAAIHIPPTLVAVWPPLIERLYGVNPDGTLGLLLMHRGVLFMAVAGLCILAACRPSYRRVAAAVTATSILSFVGLYGVAGLPEGPIRQIAAVDMAALVPLVVVARHVTKSQPRRKS